jgi:hypothetical protein
MEEMERRKEERKEGRIDAKALMVIGSLCPISVEGVIRELRWSIIRGGGAYG